MGDKPPDPAAEYRLAAATYATAARALEVGIRQVRRLVANGKLEVIGAGHQKRVTRESLSTYQSRREEIRL
jgi:excisionase family DNA binding protein